MEKFVRESNKIEGILRNPSKREIEVHYEFLAEPLSIPSLQKFVSVCARGHKLREYKGLDVMLGYHLAPLGGPEIASTLNQILFDAIETDQTSYRIHCRYEYLHPFTDGNGRSGRALWLWHKQKTGHLDIALRRGFLHSWYYESLANLSV